MLEESHEDGKIVGEYLKMKILKQMKFVCTFELSSGRRKANTFKVFSISEFSQFAVSRFIWDDSIPFGPSLRQLTTHTRLSVGCVQSEKKVLKCSATCARSYFIEKSSSS